MILLICWKRITLNKAKHVLNENKLNELSKKVEAISTKGLTKDLINGSKILNERRYFSSGTLQNHLRYVLYNKYIRIFSNTSNVLPWKSIETSEDSIENINTCGSNFAPTLISYSPLINNTNNSPSLDSVNLYRFRHRFYIR